MSTSSIPSTIDQLVSIIGALDVIDTYDVMISDGWAVENQANYVLISGAENNMVDSSQAAGGISYGGPYREEDYTVSLTVSAWIGNTDQKAARDIAFAILAEIETAVRANPTLNNTVRWAQVTSASLQQSTGDSDGRYALITAGINVVNRIFP